VDIVAQIGRANQWSTRTRHLQPANALHVRNTNSKPTN